MKIGHDVIGIRAADYGTVRYTLWPGSLGDLILSIGIPDGFKKGERIKLGAFDVSPTISMQLLHHIGNDLKIAKTYAEFINIPADVHLILQEGGLFNLDKQEYLTW